MQVTVVTADNIVIVNGEGFKIDCSGLAKEGITAIQWMETDGHIEYRSTRENGVESRKPNLLINEFKYVQPYALRWSEEKVKFLEDRIKLAEGQLKVARQQAEKIQALR